MAQDASVIGTVTDDTKAVLPGRDGHRHRPRDRRADGRASPTATAQYRLRLPAGTYKLLAELSGFGPVLVPTVELLVGQNATVPITLKVAQVSETLTVTARVAARRHLVVAGRRQRRSPPDGRAAAAGTQLDGAVEDGQGHHGQRRRNSTARRRADDMFQLNLDGQQITQKIAGSGFGQPKFSREAIAEFQIVTNMFDITQGRSAGIEVQAISKSGTNTNSGSFYGYFRSDKLQRRRRGRARRAAVLESADRRHASAARSSRTRSTTSRRTNTSASRARSFTSPSQLPGQTLHASRSRTASRACSARVDDQLSPNNRLSVRGSRWDWDNPFILGGRRPSVAGVDPDQGCDERARHLVDA